MASQTEQTGKLLPVRADIERALTRIVASPEFNQSERMRRFLCFIVERTMDGDTTCLKESVIGTQVFDREIGYDPKTDSIVRVEARRLRNKLFDYQRESGAQDPLWIVLPKGGYVPEFVPRETPSFPETAAPIRPRRQRAERIAGISIGILLCAVAAWFMLHRTAPPAALLQGHPFTTWPGYEQTPSFSPDGDTIAFAARAIYSQRIGSDQALRLTHSSQPEIDPVWSPDGRQIAFLRQETGERLAVYVMQAAGSGERRVGEVKGRTSSGRLDWSQDGRFLATSDTDGAHAPRILLISAETGSRQWITEPQPGDVNDWSPAFSPDGETLAFVRQLASSVQDIYLMAIHIGQDGKAVSGQARRITFGNHQLYGHAWSADGKSILFASRPSGSLYGIWRIAVSGGAPVRVSSTEADAREPSVARKGGRMAYVCQFVDMNIWRAAVDGQTAPRPLIASTLYDTDPQYSPDGKRIAFRSDRSGNDAIWVSDAAGAEEPSRVADLNGPPLGPPRWSPDGRLLAFDSRQGGRSVIYVVSADGKGAPRQISSPQRTNSMLPNWSHDGDFLYFGSNRSGRWQVWKQPVSRDSAEQLTTEGGFSAFEMADGKTVYYSKSPSIPGIWKLPGEELAMPSASAPKWGWMPGRNGIYFIEPGPDEEQPAGIRYFDFATKKARLIGRTSAKPALGGTALSVSPDELWMAYAQVDRAGSDIILVQNFQ